MSLFTNELTIILLGTSSSYKLLGFTKWYFTQKVFLKYGLVSLNNNKNDKCVRGGLKGQNTESTKKLANLLKKLDYSQLNLVWYH